MKQISILEVNQSLYYCHETGVFTWARDSMRAKRGAIAGSKNKINGYVELCVYGKKYLAHRVAWLIARGTNAELPIDHINGNRSDNRIANLRLDESGINAQNIRKPKKQNTSGFLGVTFCRHTGRWLAQICVNRKHKNLGRFDTPEQAYAAYLDAKRLMHDGCTL